MAVLKESELWKIHSARRLHDSAQQAYMWQLMLPDAVPRPNEDMMMLSQACKLPGFSFEQKTYSVAGQEQYYPGGAKRGGPFNVRFIEVEGGLVDQFFRTWANSMDFPLSLEAPVGAASGGVSFTRWRRAKGFGDGITGHSRTATVRVITRDGAVGSEFFIVRVQLQTYGGYDLSYESSGHLIVPVTLTCDDVIRRP